MKAAGNHAHAKSLDSTHYSLVVSTMCAVGFSIVATIIASFWSSIEAKNTDAIVLHALLNLGQGPIHEQHGPNNYCRCGNQD